MVILVSGPSTVAGARTPRGKVTNEKSILNFYAFRFTAADIAGAVKGNVASMDAKWTNLASHPRFGERRAYSGRDRRLPIQPCV
jgi:hypothetical protein